MSDAESVASSAPAERAACRPIRDVDFGDRTFRWITALTAVGVLVLLAALGAEMIKASWPSIRRFGWGFVSSTTWDVANGVFGALPFIYGTVVSSLLALVIAVPISLGAAISLSEIMPAVVRRPLGFLIELLAAIPSVVYGLWGIFVLVPWIRRALEPGLAATLGFLPLFRGPPRGYGMLSAGIILAIMIVPTIASVSRDVMRAVPGSQREAAFAIGATPWETVRIAVLPAARPGILGAIILGLARALGETMAVTMVIGNRADIPVSLFSGAATMASVIANEYAEAAGSLHLAALSELGLVLLGVTLVVNVVAHWLVRRASRVPA